MVSGDESRDYWDKWLESGESWADDTTKVDDSKVLAVAGKRLEVKVSEFLDGNFYADGAFSLKSSSAIRISGSLGAFFTPSCFQSARVHIRWLAGVGWWHCARVTNTRFLVHPNCFEGSERLRSNLAKVVVSVYKRIPESQSSGPLVVFLQLGVLIAALKTRLV